MKNLISAFLLIFLSLSALAQRHFSEEISSFKPQVKSWKALRDEGITKQDLDYSCGAASLATLLNRQFNQTVSEGQILQLFIDNDGGKDKGKYKEKEEKEDKYLNREEREKQREELMASFADMQAALPKLGFRGQGYALSFEQLQKLTAPVIVYLRYRTNDHFSVLYGINDRTVLLADPSLGYLSLSKEQFLEAWNTRDGQLAGKILAVIPAKGSGARASGDFFRKHPQRQTDNSFIFEQLPRRH